MLRKESEAVPEGNGLVHEEEEFGSGQPAPVDVFRRIDEIWDRGIDKMMIYLEQHLASQEHDARQPRLAMEADGPANTKTRERTEGAATVVQVMRGGSCSPDRVDPDPICSTNSGNDCTGPPAPPCLGENALVDNRAAVPKSCLPFLEMRSPSAAGGFVSTCKTSPATEITFNEPLLQFYLTEEANCKKTSTPYVLYDSSVWNLLTASSCRRVIETKPMQNRKFDPGGSQGRLRACPF